MNSHANKKKCRAHRTHCGHTHIRTYLFCLFLSLRTCVVQCWGCSGGNHKPKDQDQHLCSHLLKDIKKGLRILQVFHVCMKDHRKVDHLPSVRTSSRVQRALIWLHWLCSWRPSSLSLYIYVCSSIPCEEQTCLFSGPPMKNFHLFVCETTLRGLWRNAQLLNVTKYIKASWYKTQEIDGQKCYIWTVITI